MKKLKQLIFNEYFGVNSENFKINYYESLPEELEKWHIYDMDGGHSIFVLPKQFEQEKTDDIPEFCLVEYYLENMLPIPVKTVLRGYSVNQDGVIVVSGLDYSDSIGVSFPSIDEEFEDISKEKYMDDNKVMHSTYNSDNKYYKFDTETKMPFPKNNGLLEEFTEAGCESLIFEKTLIIKWFEFEIVISKLNRDMLLFSICLGKLTLSINILTKNEIYTIKYSFIELFAHHVIKECTELELLVASYLIYNPRHDLPNKKTKVKHDDIESLLISINP